MLYSRFRIPPEAEPAEASRMTLGPMRRLLKTVGLYGRRETAWSVPAIEQLPLFLSFAVNAKIPEGAKRSTSTRGNPQQSPAHLLTRMK
jgi:hypothetical protein